MTRQTPLVTIDLLLALICGCGSMSSSSDAGSTAGSTGHGGSGATGVGGTGGSVGSGGTAGASPCQAVVALNRSCTVATDCFAAGHQTNCCGSRSFVGMNTSAQAQYQTLEPKCDAMYPACGCAEGPSTADDGSSIPLNATPGIACIQGICTTYDADCGKPCASGTTCFSCSNHSVTYAACTTMCTASTACTDSRLPMCQFGSSGNTSGMFCTASGVACDTK